MLNSRVHAGTRRRPVGHKEKKREREREGEREKERELDEMAHW